MCAVHSVRAISAVEIKEGAEAKEGRMAMLLPHCLRWHHGVGFRGGVVGRSGEAGLEV